MVRSRIIGKVGADNKNKTISWEPFLAECALAPKLQQLSGNKFLVKSKVDNNNNKHNFLGTIFWQSARWHQSSTHFLGTISWQSARCREKYNNIQGTVFLAKCGLAPKVTPFSGNHFLAESALAPPALETFFDILRADTKILNIEQINPSSKRTPAPCRLEMSLSNTMGIKMGAGRLGNGDGNRHQWRRQWT